MPKPGSHKYDTERAHLRKRLEKEGINDKEADRRANEILQQDPQKQPEAPDDRAAGPKGDPPRVREASAELAGGR